MVLISFSTSTKQRYTDSLASRVQQANQKFVMRHFQGMIMLQHNLGSKIYFYSCEITTKLRENVFLLLTKQTPFLSTLSLSPHEWKELTFPKIFVEYTSSTGTTMCPMQELVNMRKGINNQEDNINFCWKRIDFLKKICVHINVWTFAFVYNVIANTFALYLHIYIVDQISKQ